MLALTPIAVAVSRHNNPDALLVLCWVGRAVGLVRALEDGRTRWLVLAARVGLGFETKMGAALLVVPGDGGRVAVGRARGRSRALRQLLGRRRGLVVAAAPGRC